MTLTSTDVKRAALDCGADLCGIAPMDRFEGAPAQQDPRYIFPAAKTAIVLGFRVPRGYLRGIEEGTYFTAYPSMGYAGLNVTYMPMVLREFCCFIEDHGYEASPLTNKFVNRFRTRPTWPTWRLAARGGEAPRPADGPSDGAE